MNNLKIRKKTIYLVRGLPCERVCVLKYLDLFAVFYFTVYKNNLQTKCALIIIIIIIELQLFV